jgi:hypothetical protein
MYALKPSEARRQYPKSLKLLFDFLGLPGSSLEEQATEFLEKARQDIQWCQMALSGSLIFINNELDVKKVLQAH